MEDDDSDWQVVDGKRKVYYHKPTGFSTFDKPDVLLTDEEKSRDEALRTGNLSLSFLSSVEDTFETKEPENKLGSSNVGFQMLQKFGWTAESGLGKAGQGIKEPIRPQAMDTIGSGIGKQEEYDRVVDDATRERKKLNVEIDQTHEMIQKQNDNFERITKIENEKKVTNREFYCDICDKQYKSVLEMSVHLDSLDHGHKKRFKEMRSISRKRNEGCSDWTNNSECAAAGT
eukprot:gene5782-11682_t